MRGFRERGCRKKEKTRDFLPSLVVDGRVCVLSQLCPIWRRRVLTIGLSLVSVASLRFLANPSRAAAPKAPQQPRDRNQPWSRFASVVPITRRDVLSKLQAEGMEIIDEKANDAHNPPMETEEIVSVLDREFRLGRPRRAPRISLTPSSVLQRKLSPPNTCLISAMT